MVGIVCGWSAIMLASRDKLTGSQRGRQRQMCGDCRIHGAKLTPKNRPFSPPKRLTALDSSVISADKSVCHFDSSWTESIKSYVP